MTYLNRSRVKCQIYSETNTHTNKNIFLKLPIIDSVGFNMTSQDSLTMNIDGGYFIILKQLFISRT